MPLDPTNPPFQRSAPFESDSPGLGTSVAVGVSAYPANPPAHLDGNLKLENMLLEEFNYASTTAYQSMEDRARFFNLYLVLVGILASGLGAAYQIGGEVRTYLPTLAVILLFAIGALGSVFFLTLIRLRRAFRDSLIAMGKAKQFYINQFKSQFPNIDEAFHWKLETTPSGERLGSVTFLVVYTVAVLACFCYTVGAFVLYEHWFSIKNLSALVPAVGSRIVYGPAILLFLLLLLFHIMYYRRAFSSKKDKEQLKREVELISKASRR